MGILPNSIQILLITYNACSTVALLHVEDARRAGNRDIDVPIASSPSVIVVPGGGLTEDAISTTWVLRRLKEAAQIYSTRRVAGETCVIVALSLGTPHKPMPIDPHSRFQVPEAEASARALIHDFGVPPEDVFEETWSLDTIGNAYMLRVEHTDIAGWTNLTIITNEFHMPRTRAIFEKVFSLGPKPTSGNYNLSFIDVPNDGLPQDVVASRKDRELQSVKEFHQNTAQMRTMRDLHRFLFSEHLAYASKRLLEPREPIDPKTADSYL